MRAMQTHRRAFVRRAILIPAALGCAVAAAQVAFTAPAPTAQASADPTRAAETQIEQQTHDLTDGLTCYPDPTGHQPATAVVKDDGGVTAYTLPAGKAWDAAHAGDVWVLAWCDPKEDR